MIDAILIVIAAVVLYLIGRIHGQVETDDKAGDLLDEERHRRIVAQEYSEQLERELHAAMVHNEHLARQNDALLLKLVRHGVERDAIALLLQKGRPVAVEVANG